eukprot:TRINITY_DN111724_c0_g1_i1.p1 TRINITY_DN111724_c0_g1~~TRINITY_DN111724_c0_g1_i1.p1  ORF type:complete len:324 (-),score=49.75 TRINITY_DN111724_c0_g1_i1:46-1017(-)
MDPSGSGFPHIRGSAQIAPTAAADRDEPTGGQNGSRWRPKPSMAANLLSGPADDQTRRGPADDQETDAILPRLPPAPAAAREPCAWCSQNQVTQLHAMIGQAPGKQAGKAPRRGAGVVALRGSSEACQPGQCSLQVCLVSGKKQQLGFPKGGQKQQETPIENAKREWTEETGLDGETLKLSQEVVLVDSWGCHYFVAGWPVESAADLIEESWEPPCEDPSDPDPILQAQWMPVGKALAHQRLSWPRKELLRAALAGCCCHDGTEMAAGSQVAAPAEAAGFGASWPEPNPSAASSQSSAYGGGARRWGKAGSAKWPWRQAAGPW